MTKIFLWLWLVLLLTSCSIEEEMAVISTDEESTDEVSPQLDAGDLYLQSLIENHGNFLPTPESIEDDTLKIEEEIVTYTVKGDLIVNRKVMQTDNDFRLIAEDTMNHENLWELFASLIPAGEREMVNEFVIFTDGRDNTLGYVEPIQDREGEWKLAIDYEDTHDIKELYTTLIHEFGHLLTLNLNEVPQDELSENELDEAIDACDTYYAMHGCSYVDSYMNLFFQEFWQHLYEEWEELEVEFDEEAQIDFFESHEDKFLTEYAATHPEEDIAEALMYFIFTEKPNNDTKIKNQKVLFFYQFPELIELRRHILKNISESLY